MHGIASIASDIYEHISRQGTEATIRLNDMSLPFGGLFDICGSWNPNQTCPPLTPANVGGHFSHRTGRSVDVSRSLCLGLATDPAIDCTQTIPLDRLLFERRCLARGGRVAQEERYHCEFIE